MNPANQHVSEPFRTILNNTWDSARTAARKLPTTAQADEALSRDLGVEFADAAKPPCSCDPFKPKNSSHRDRAGWLVCANCQGRIGAENPIALARNLTPLWSMMRRPDDTVFLAPGDNGDDPTCLAVYPNRDQADQAVERWDRENERRLKLDAEFPGGKDVAWAERDDDDCDGGEL